VGIGVGVVVGIAVGVGVVIGEATIGHKLFGFEDIIDGITMPV
jgi:hypothetical protein